MAATRYNMAFIITTTFAVLTHAEGTSRHDTNQDLCFGDVILNKHDSFWIPNEANYSVNIEDVWATFNELDESIATLERAVAKWNNPRIHPNPEQTPLTISGYDEITTDLDVYILEGDAAHVLRECYAKGGELPEIKQHGFKRMIEFITLLGIKSIYTPVNVEKDIIRSNRDGIAIMLVGTGKTEFTSKDTGLAIISIRPSTTSTPQKLDITVEGINTSRKYACLFQKTERNSSITGVLHVAGEQRVQEQVSKYQRWKKTLVDMINKVPANHDTEVARSGYRAVKFLFVEKVKELGIMMSIIATQPRQDLTRTLYNDFRLITVYFKTLLRENRVINDVLRTLVKIGTHIKDVEVYPTQKREKIYDIRARFMDQQSSEHVIIYRINSMLLDNMMSIKDKYIITRDANHHQGISSVDYTTTACDTLDGFKRCRRFRVHEESKLCGASILAGATTGVMCAKEKVPRYAMLRPRCDIFKGKAVLITSQNKTLQCGAFKQIAIEAGNTFINISSCPGIIDTASKVAGIATKVMNNLKNVKPTRNEAQGSIDTDDKSSEAMRITYFVFSIIGVIGVVLLIIVVIPLEICNRSAQCRSWCHCSPTSDGSKRAEAYTESAGVLAPPPPLASNPHYKEERQVERQSSATDIPRFPLEWVQPYSNAKNPQRLTGTVGRFNNRL